MVTNDLRDEKDMAGEMNLEDGGETAGGGRGAIEGVLEGSGFHELQRDERREFWNELLYDQGYRSEHRSVGQAGRSRLSPAAS